MIDKQVTRGQVNTNFSDDNIPFGVSPYKVDDASPCTLANRALIPEIGSSTMCEVIRYILHVTVMKMNFVNPLIIQ